MPRSASRAGELVPLADRIRALAVLRAALLAAVGLLAVGGGGAWSVRPGPVVAVGAAFLVLAEVLGRTHLRARRGLPVLGLLLLADGLALQVVTALTGGAASPLRHLVLVQVVVVALVASYRTGLKLAIWHSLILLVLHEAAATGVLPALLRTGAEHPAPLVAAVWLAAIATSTASSVNERELRRRRFESEALAGMAASLEAASQPDTVAAILVAAAAETLDLPRAVVLDTRDGARVLAAHGAVGAPAGAAVSPLLARVTARREPVLLAGIPQADEAWLAALLPEARNVVLLPMAAQGRAFAVLVAEHGARVGSGLERRTLATAERIADHGALSLSNAWLHRRLAEHAHTDGLTGVANRRAFDTAFDAARAGDDDVALLLLDLDHFKRVNDVHGHEVGDEVLRQLGHLLMAQVPAAALPARFGGEEFAVLWPGADPEEARATAEALRAAIAAAPMPVPVTASVGVAHLRAGRGDTSTLLRAADEALYAAKHAGRDRVVGPAVTAPAPVTANASTRPIPMPVLDPAQGTAP